jgi:hypothetical protein
MDEKKINLQRIFTGIMPKIVEHDIDPFSILGMSKKLKSG